MMSVIHAMGFQTSPYQLRVAGVDAPVLRAVLVAEPRYLGNGFRCANVFFFSHGRYVGRDSGTCHLYPRIDWGDGQETSIVYPRYARRDPLCCPTLDPARVIFTLVNGQMERASGRLPS